MDDFDGVQVSQCQSNITTESELDLPTQRYNGRLEEMGETLVHEFHEEHRLSGGGLLTDSQILDDVGVLDVLQVLTLQVKALLESLHSWVSSEDAVEGLCCAGQLIAFGSVDSSKGTMPQLCIRGVTDDLVLQVLLAN